MSASRAEDTLLVVSRSVGRIIPRTVITWFSEFTFRCLVPSTTRLPFTRTWVTRAETVVVNAVVRLGVPSPSSDWLVPRFNRFASPPVGLLMPAREVMLALAADAREVLDCPVLTADALSDTRMV